MVLGFFPSLCVLLKWHKLEPHEMQAEERELDSWGTLLNGSVGGVCWDVAAHERLCDGRSGGKCLEVQFCWRGSGEAGINIFSLVAGGRT